MAGLLAAMAMSLEAGVIVVVAGIAAGGVVPFLPPLVTFP